MLSYKTSSLGEWSSEAPSSFPSLAIDIHGACIWNTQLDLKERQHGSWTQSSYTQACECLPKGFTNNSLIVNRMGIKADTIKHNTLNEVN